MVLLSLCLCWLNAGPLSPLDFAAAHAAPGEIPVAVTVDDRGYTYITGTTTAPQANLSTAAAAQFRPGAAPVYVTMLDPSGANRLYTAYLGGSGFQSVRAIAVDKLGNAYIAGSTGSSDFPVTGGVQRNLSRGLDAFVAKLSAKGTSWVYSTFIGGQGDDIANGITVDQQGNLYVAGQTTSSDFPSINAAQPTRIGDADAFVLKLNSAGSGILYSTYVGGGARTAANAIALDQNGAVYIAGTVAGPAHSGGAVTAPGSGQDAFVLKLDAASFVRRYASSIGGSGDEEGTSVAVDASGSAYVTGWTNSSDFPATTGSSPAGGRDVFVTKLGPQGNRIYSTRMGGSQDDIAQSIAVDFLGNAYIAGETNSTDFAADASVPGTLRSFLTKLSSDGTHQLILGPVSTAAASSGVALAVQPAGRAIIAGTRSAGDAFAAAVWTCSYRLSDATKSVGAQGETGTVTVTTSPECAWSAVSTAPWLVVSQSGVGNGSFSYTVAPNSGAPRGASIAVGDQTLLVMQSGHFGLSIQTGGFTGAIRTNAGFQTSTFGPCDDCSSAAVNLGFPINFFGNNYTTVFVNNNGNVTFGASTNAFTPTSIPQLPNVMIAPFWADVDTDGPGSGVTTYGTDIVNGHHAFGVNWINVGYYFQATNKLDSFQLVLIERGDVASGAFDIEMNYSSVQWETGSHSSSGGVNGLGGHSARVGFTNGSGATGTFFELPGSGVNGALLDGGPNSLIANSTNSGLAGRYIYPVRAVVCAEGINPTSANVPIGGGPLTIAVTASRSDCTWTVTGVPTWITINAPPGGNGTGSMSVMLQVQSNNGAPPRSAALTIAGQSYTIFQDGVYSFSWTVNPSGAGTVSPAAGNYSPGTQLTIAATANAGFVFTSWSGGLSGSSNPQSVVLAAPLSVTANFANCSTLALSSSSASFTSGGGNGTFTVTPTACPANVAPSVTWIHPSISGGTVTYTVDANPNTTQRQGTISVIATGQSTGQIFTITQAGKPPAAQQPCLYSISPGSSSFPASGGSGSFTLSITPLGQSCPWSAVSPDGSLTGITPTSGSASTTINYTVPANNGATTRIGTITITGQGFAGAFTTTQPPPAVGYQCTVGLGTARPAIRVQSASELVADVKISCSGAAPAGDVFGDLVVTLNANITSRIVSADNTEALLLLGEPATPVLNTNAFRGKIAGGNSVVWHNVKLRPSNGGPFTLRLTDLRVNASQLGVIASLVPTSIVATVQMSSIPVTTATVAVANLQQGISSSSSLHTVTPTAGPVSGTFLVPASFTQGFAGAFRPRVATGQDPSALGTSYNSESGYVNTTVLGTQTGFASNGIRLLSRLFNIPAGIRVFASVFPSSDQSAHLIVNTDSSGAGGISAGGPFQFNGLYQELPVVNGAALAVWEVVAGNPPTTLSFNVVFQGSASLAQMLVSNEAGPITTQFSASNTAPTPRFVDAGGQPPATVQLQAVSSLRITTPSSPLVRFQGRVVSRAGASTGMEIEGGVVNTSGTTAPHSKVHVDLPPEMMFTNLPAQCADSSSSCGSQSFTVDVGDLGQGQSAAVDYSVDFTSGAPPGTVSTITTQVWSNLPNQNLLLALTTESFRRQNAQCAVQGLTVSPSPLVPTIGGNISITVPIDSLCTFTLSADQTWVAFTSPVFGTGTQTMTAHIGANSSPTMRTANLLVNGQLQPTRITQSGTAAGDLDSNGVPDLVWQNDSTGQVFAWYMGGSLGNNFIGGIYLDPVGHPGWTVAGIADLNADGHADLIWQNDSTRQVYVWYMGGPLGNNYLGATFLDPVGHVGWRLVGLADFNNDGHPDLVWQNETTRQVYVWYMGGTLGNTYLGAVFLASTGMAGWTVVGMADFNSDGTPDLVWQNDLTHQVFVWYMGGPLGNNFLGSTYLDSIGHTGWTVAGIADANNDGHPDIMWQNTTTRQVYVWYMGGTLGNNYLGALYLDPAGHAGWTLRSGH